MGYIGWDDVAAAGGKQHFFTSDDHFQLTFEDIGDLLMNMVMFG
jgi:hypothetical protein